MSAIMIDVVLLLPFTWERFGPYASSESAEENLRENGWQVNELGIWWVQHTRCCDVLTARIITAEDDPQEADVKSPADLPRAYVPRVQAYMQKRVYNEPDLPGFEPFVDI